MVLQNRNLILYLITILCIYSVSHARAQSRDDSLFISGYSHFQEENFEHAIEILSEIDPDYLLRDYVLYFIAESLFNQEKLSEANGIYHFLLKRHSQSLLAIDSKMRIAECYREIGDHKQSIIIYDLIIDSYRKKKEIKQAIYLKAKFNKAVTLDELGDWQSAERIYRELWTHFPQSPFSQDSYERLEIVKSKYPIRDFSLTELITRGNVLYKRNRYDQAAKIFQKINELINQNGRLEGLPKNFRIDRLLLKLGISHYKSKSNEAAITVLKQILSEERESNLVPAALYYLSKTYWRDVEIREDEFVTAVSTLIENYPTSSLADDSYFNLAKYYLVDKLDSDKALDAFYNFLLKFPRSNLVTGAKWQVSWIHYLEKEYDEAIEGMEDLRKGNLYDSLFIKSLYWQARASEKIGRAEEALALYSRLLDTYPRNYYASLAGSRKRSLLEQYPAQNEKSKVGSNEPSNLFIIEPLPEKIRSDTHFRKGQRLKELKLYNYALDEIREIYQKYSDTSSLLIEYSALNKLTENHNLSRRLIIRHLGHLLSKNKSDIPKQLWELAYPMGYRDVIEREANKNQLDPFLIAAIISNESDFNPGAISHVGARGLMQLMPATAHSIAQELNVKDYSPSMLYDPETNIVFGTHYFKQILELDFYGLWIPAIMSYNAGETKVKEWISPRQNLEFDEFIEDIPFEETIKFVKRVMRDYWEYKRIYGDSQDGTITYAKIAVADETLGTQIGNYAFTKYSNAYLLFESKNFAEARRAFEISMAAYHIINEKKMIENCENWIAKCSRKLEVKSE